MQDFIYNVNPLRLASFFTMGFSVAMFVVICLNTWEQRKRSKAFIKEMRARVEAMIAERHADPETTPKVFAVMDPAEPFTDTTLKEIRIEKYDILKKMATHAMPSSQVIIHLAKEKGLPTVGRVYLAPDLERIEWMESLEQAETGDHLIRWIERPGRAAHDKIS